MEITQKKSKNGRTQPFIGFQKIDSDEEYNNGPKRTQEQYPAIL